MADQTSAKDRASRILRQLAAVEVERAELARALGADGAGAFEDELARLWRALASVVDGEGFDIARVAAGSAERDPWAEKPSALTFWGNLNAEQEAGVACLICGDGFNLTYPAAPSAAINNKQMRAHVDPARCTKVLAGRLEKELPF